MKLMTKALEKTLPTIGTTEGQGDEAIVEVKFFLPGSSWTWYGVEYNPKERMFYGLVYGFEMELGYFSLTELEELKGQFGLGIERDLWWTPCSIKEIKNGGN
jgi:hypothetical protein